MFGFNKEHGNYSRFLVQKIIKIVDVRTKNLPKDIEPIVVGYDYFGSSNLELLPNEKIKRKINDDKIRVEITSKNKFDILQRILYHSPNCEVIYPESFRTELVDCLKKMRDVYAK